MSGLSCLLGLGGQDLCVTCQRSKSTAKGHGRGKGERTLDISDALLKDLLEGLGVLELLGDLGDDALGQLLLLPLLDLALVPHPRLQDGLGLGGQGSLLLELVGLGLKLGGFLGDRR